MISIDHSCQRCGLEPSFKKKCRELELPFEIPDTATEIYSTVSTQVQILTIVYLRFMMMRNSGSGLSSSLSSSSYSSCICELELSYGSCIWVGTFI